MSLWTSRVRDHRVWQLMKGLGPTIDDALAKEDVDADSRESLERLKVVLAFIGKRLGSCDPLMIRVNALESLANAFDVQQNEVKAFLTDGLSAHITTANDYADAAIGITPELLGIASPEEAIDLVQSTNSLRESVEQRERVSAESRKHAQDEIAKLTSSLESLRTQVEAEQKKVIALAADQTKIF